MSSNSAEILLVTVTEVEGKAVLKVFEEATGKKAIPIIKDGRHYFKLGDIHGAAIAMTQCEMGGFSIDASLITVQKAIDALSPAAVIMVGIAFGMDEGKQEIGDILVADYLRPYELQRVGKDETILRHDRVPAARSLRDRMKSANLQWEGAKVKLGTLLTGEKLVDNKEFREQLRRLDPEAIGGEMEGAGLYVACQNQGVDWILVKAICDWADGDKGKDKTARQKTAATNAATFVAHALQFVPFQRAAPVETISHSSLPVQPFFFGREKDLASIAQAILPESRTWGVLIDGEGGIGKTALAIRAGHLAPTTRYPRKIFLSAKVRDLTPEGEQKREDFALRNYLTLLSELALELGQKDLAKVAENERADAVRLALIGVRALIVIDNVETFPKDEQVRLYQFLNVLPPGCKAIVTSRRRSDVSAQVIRLERLEQKDALDLLAELAKTNRYLASAKPEWQTLYEVTGGNPLLLRWTAGQLGRTGSQCRTVAEACEYLKNAPLENDPLEYIFGDLLGTFTESETAVLAALTHFTQPALVKWIADLAGIAPRQAETALDDLADRALLVADPASQAFFLPRLAAKFLRDKRPEAVAQTGDRLADRAYALALENGYSKHERFPVLEAEWLVVVAALPRLVDGENARLQVLCGALQEFLNFSGRWDECLWFEQQAEEKALAANDSYNAGWQAFRIGWVHNLRGQAAEVLACATRAESHWKEVSTGAHEQATAIRLRGLGLMLEKKYAEAITTHRQALDLWRTIADESIEVARALNSLAAAERAIGDDASADRDYREALRIAVNRRLAKFIDVMLGNEEDFTASFGFNVDGEDQNLTHLDAGRFKRMLEAVIAEFPFQVAATTLRGATTATRNDWGALCYAEGSFYEAPMRNDLEIYDRVGGGDSFASGLIYGFLTGRCPQWSVECGAAHGALAMTTPGDTSMAVLSEVLALMDGKAARITR